MHPRRAQSSPATPRLRIGTPGTKRGSLPSGGPSVCVVGKMYVFEGMQTTSDHMRCTNYTLHTTHLHEECRVSFHILESVLPHSSIELEEGACLHLRVNNAFKIHQRRHIDTHCNVQLYLYLPPRECTYTWPYQATAGRCDGVRLDREVEQALGLQGPLEAQI
jgi:hypothetical protein